jgi:hypothetical protein
MGIASLLERLENRGGRDIVERDEADQTKSPSLQFFGGPSFCMRDSAKPSSSTKTHQPQASHLKNRRRQMHLLSSSTYIHPHLLFLLTIILFILDITNGRPK